MSCNLVGYCNSFNEKFLNCFIISSQMRVKKSHFDPLSDFQHLLTAIHLKFEGFVTTFYIFYLRHFKRHCKGFASEIQKVFHFDPNF